MVLPILLSQLASRYGHQDKRHHQLVDLARQCTLLPTTQQRVKETSANIDLEKLNLPVSAMLIDSLYIERTDDHELLNNLFQPRRWFTIKAPRQTGKTSLLLRALAKAEADNVPTITLNLDGFAPTSLKSYQPFLHYFLKSISDDKPKKGH